MGAMRPVRRMGLRLHNYRVCMGADMTDTNNGWPGKPGVPLNPEKDGWHWASLLGDRHPQIIEWFSDAMQWDGGWTTEDFGQHFRYLGPVLDPDEATALQDRIAELEAALATARREGMEEAAKIADSCAADWDKSAKGKYLETKWDYESRADAGEEIAATIRAAAGEVK